MKTKPFNASIIYAKRHFEDRWYYYIVIHAGSQQFKGDKGYVHHKRAVTAAQKMGLAVMEG